MSDPRKIKVGDSFHYRFGGPGPDITLLTVTGVKEDGTVVTWDLYFRFTIEIAPDMTHKLNSLNPLNEREQLLVSNYWGGK